MTAGGWTSKTSLSTRRTLRCFRSRCRNSLPAARADCIQRRQVDDNLAIAERTLGGRSKALELLERTSGPGRHGRPWPAQLTEPLSGRELTVLRHLQSPLTLAEIAGHLYVSVNTIKSQARSIYRKLGVDDRHQAAQRARDLRLG